MIQEKLQYLVSLAVIIIFNQKNYVNGWTSLVTFSQRHHHLKPSNKVSHQSREAGPLYSSTPFEADYYGDAYTKNPYLEEVSPLAVSADTKLIIGLNKYSHDTSICAADASTGIVLFALSKERLTRKKHDAGNVAVLVEKCLECLDLDLDAIQHVVVNNHHNRILPIETNRQHMEWEEGLLINNGAEAGYNDDLNLIPDASKQEISHHLAHAYSTATQSPFDKGMICILDGMGETYRAMKFGKKDANYTSDFDLSDNIQLIPSDLHERETLYDWREAESVYTFEKTDNGIKFVPVFKRFQQENSPPTLYNHGFENMDSLGALYSRVSSHIFGDWNACGKVMGLAPWSGHSWNNGEKVPPVYDKPICSGSLYKEEDGAFTFDRTLMEGIPLVARNDAELFDPETMVKRRRYDFDDDKYQPEERKKQRKRDEDNEDVLTVSTLTKPLSTLEKQLPAQVALDAIGVASRMQQDLEEVVIDFVSHFQKETGETNLCLAGGVGLNSVINGRLARELGFEETYLAPYPGDDGISVGCCAFGLYGGDPKQQTPPPPIWKKPLSPYLGPAPTDFDIKMALQAAEPWIEIETIQNEELRIDRIVTELDKGAVIALYQGRSEMGPRALGHRSILADPRQKPMVRFINEMVKKRESFRPFAPSVLAEEADAWFDLGDTSNNGNVSPYMSMTALVNEDKRDLIPAVTHVDGSSRLQTVTAQQDPFYYALISAFHRRTDIPMVLNTSFNTIPGEPIVESPVDAIRSFLNSLGSIKYLVMGNYIIRRKRPNIGALLGEGSAYQTGDKIVTQKPLCPKRAGPIEFEAKFSLNKSKTAEEEVDTFTRVRMPERIMHHEEKNNWFNLVDELEGEILSICDGTNTVNDVMAYFTMKNKEEEYTDEDIADSRQLVEQITSRVIRLFEHTFVSW